MGYIEITAKTVDEAITKASIQLETASDELDIQVISEGSSGFLGIGSKPAIIKVCKKQELEVIETVNTIDDFSDIEKSLEKSADTYAKIESEKTDKYEKVQEYSKESQRDEAPRPKPATLPPKTEEEIALMKETSRQFLSGVFEAMGMDVKIDMDYDYDEGCLNINFVGEDMGILIGKRGQTLDSLQYITTLVVNKKQENYSRLKLDTENYRKRRKITLENLARNISYKVKKTRRPVSLEPMNPYERRIIHSALQHNRYVETYSEGTEPYRHVVITLKKNRY